MKKSLSCRQARVPRKEKEKRRLRKKRRGDSGRVNQGWGVEREGRGFSSLPKNPTEQGTQAHRTREADRAEHIRASISEKGGQNLCLIPSLLQVVAPPVCKQLHSACVPPTPIQPPPPLQGQSFPFETASFFREDFEFSLWLLSKRDKSKQQ